MSVPAPRLADVDDPSCWPPPGLDESVVCYWKQAGKWMIWLPGAGLGDLSNHGVQEHEDGTITAHPSILVSGVASGKTDPTNYRIDVSSHLGSRHGYLERGVWRDV